LKQEAKKNKHSGNRGRSPHVRSTRHYRFFAAQLERDIELMPSKNDCNYGREHTDDACNHNYQQQVTSMFVRASRNINV